MIYDGIVTYAVTKELNNKIISGRIEKISMPSNLEIDIYIYAGQKYILKIDCNPSSAKIYLSKEKKTSPLVPPTFCMVLRKHLEGSKITGISQYMLDRIIQIDFETFSEMKDKQRKSLIIELMGKHSNCIFVDSDKNIIDSLKHITPNISSVRTVLPNLKYTYPITKNNFLETSVSDYLNAIANTKDQTISIANYLISAYNGFSKVFISHILSSVNINVDTDINTLNQDQYIDIYNNIQNAIKSIDNSSFRIDSECKHLVFNTDCTTSINDFLDTYYTNLEKQNSLIQLKNTLIKQLNISKKRLISKFKNAEDNLKECYKMDTYKIFGELLSANLYRLKEKTDSITVQNYYNANQDITIPLDKKLTPSQNSQKYFKKYAKLKNTYSYSLPEKEKLENEIEYIDSIIYSIESCNNTNDIIDIQNELIHQKYIKRTEKGKQKQNTEKQDIKEKLEKHTFEGYTIYVGKNNLQNEYIAHKLGKDNDMWLHVQKAPGSHVIIQNSTNTNIPENVIEYAATIAASHSKLKHDSKVNIDYCNVKYVKKHPSNKPGLVTYTNFSTITVKPM